MKLLLWSTTIGSLASSPVMAEDPIVLNPETKLRFHAQQNLPREIHVRVPSNERVAGIERLEFTFRFKEPGLVRTPEIALKIGEKPFVIPPADLFVFEAPPKDAIYHVAHAALPQRPHMVAMRIYYRGDESKRRIALAHVHFNPTPPGVATRWISVRNAGPNLHAMSFFIDNASGHPFILTNTNFKNLPEGVTIPPITIPSAP